MMLTACFTPFLVGALIKFGIPLIEKAAKFSLQPYYPMFDLFPFYHGASASLFCFCHDYLRRN